MLDQSGAPSPFFSNPPDSITQLREAENLRHLFFDQRLTLPAKTVPVSVGVLYWVRFLFSRLGQFFWLVFLASFAAVTVEEWLRKALDQMAQKPSLDLAALIPSVQTSTPSN